MRGIEPVKSPIISSENRLSFNLRYKLVNNLYDNAATDCNPLISSEHHKTRKIYGIPYFTFILFPVFKLTSVNMQLDILYKYRN